MELAFREYGEGRPLVILHGLFGQSDNWNTLAKKFSDGGFRVFTVDLRNHGLSPHSDTFNFESMAGDLAEFISGHRLQNPYLIGHSLGGKVVLSFERLHPGIAGKLVIADIAARQYEPHHQSVIEALNSVDLERIDNRREAEEALSGRIADAGTRQFLLKNLYWKDKHLAWRFNLEVITRDYDEVVAEIPFYTSTTPTLIVRGEKSDYVQQADIADFKLRFSNCTVTTIKGAGHWVHAEKPEAFCESVLAFIRS